MTESRLESKLSAKTEIASRRRYLVRRGQSWRFQIRIPADLGPCRKKATLRVNLGALPIRSAERKARELAAVAELAFARLGRVKTMDDQTGEAPHPLDQSIFAIESRQFSELGRTLLTALRQSIARIEESEGYDPSQTPE